MSGNISKLREYIPMVNFLASFLGKDCEVLLHDTNNLERSIIAVANNHLSGRQVGGPLTDLALKILKNEEHLNRDFLGWYKAKSKDGKDLHSATYFIKDENKNLIGMICVNLDVTKLVKAKSLLEEFTLSTSFGLPDTSQEIEEKQSEKFSASLEDLTTSIIEEVIAEAEVPPARMVAEEKMAIVNTLSEKGVFLLKGAVAEVAKYLDASEATIYRYLNKTHN